MIRLVGTVEVVDRIQHVQSSPPPVPPTSVLPMVMMDMLVFDDDGWYGNISKFITTT